MAAAVASPFVRSSGRILVASADSDFRKRVMASPVYMRALREEAVGGAHALARLGQVECDSVLLDRNLPDLDALEVAEAIRQKYPQIEVEFVDSKLASTSENQGSSADVADAHDDDEESALGVDEMNAVDEPFQRAQEGTTETMPGLVGTSVAMQKVSRLVHMVAPRDTTVLITGETGTGKELIAHAVHALSTRAKHPFVVVNCAAIPDALFEAELFGYTRGAFTGAVQSRLGRVHVAQGGTLFLDEVGELPLSMQAKLLRFLQNGEVQRLGSAEVFRVDVRVVCATNVSLQQCVQNKQFRQDLYYRLAVFPIAIPPLRERAQDVGLLSAHFLAQLSRQNNMPGKYLTGSALTYLQHASWDGNVRELQHAIERAFILSGNETALRPRHFQRCGDEAY